MCGMGIKCGMGTAIRVGVLERPREQTPPYGGTEGRSLTATVRELTCREVGSPFLLVILTECGVGIIF